MPLSPGSKLAGLFLDPEDGNNTFPRIVGELVQNYIPSLPSRQHVTQHTLYLRTASCFGCFSHGDPLTGSEPYRPQSNLVARSVVLTHKCSV
jgi:hypothetical protein